MKSTATLLISILLIGLAPVTYAQCDFTIFTANPTPSCLYAFENVKWSSVTNAETPGNGIVKDAGGNAWNSGGFAINRVHNNGWAETVVDETNTERLFGLSTNDSGVDFNSVQFAIRLRNNGNLEIVESGSNRGNVGNYNSGDTLRIKVDEDQIKYYRNKSLLYISRTVPTLPLVVDVSLFTLNASLREVVVANGMDGNFNSSITSAGTGAVYQWKKNGLNLGSNLPNFVDNNLVDGDQLLCEVAPGAGGCSPTLQTSNTITIRSISASEFGEVYVSTTPEVNACLNVETPVRWATLSNVTDLEGILERFPGSGWNATAFSSNAVNSNGYAQTIVAQGGRQRMFGLSNTNIGNFNVEYGFLLSNINGNLRIYESGTDRGSFGKYAIDDTLRIAVEKGTVKYYRNSTLLYTSNVTPTLPLYVDVALESSNSTLQDITLSNGSQGTFNANLVNLGTNPQYQWQLNGQNVGGNSGVYTAVNIDVGDIVSILVTPTQLGCTEPIESASVTTEQNTDFDFGELYITNQPEADACLLVSEPAAWASLIRVEETATGIVRQAGTGWSASAFSINAVHDNGYAQATIADGSQSIFGISNTNIGTASVEYGFVLTGINGNFRISESGIDRGAFGKYALNDNLRVAVEEGVVKYYINNTLLYESAVAPTLPLRVDVGFDGDGSAYDNVIVANGSQGTFLANVTNAGANPAYQWKVDGTEVGTNNSSYTDTELSTGNQVTVAVVPDLAGCNNAFEARPVTVLEKSGFNPPGFYISNVSEPDACLLANEPIQWENLVNILETTTGIARQAGSGWNATAFSLNAVFNNGYVETVVTQTGRQRMFGLSQTNIGNFNVQYGFHLLNTNSILLINEAGVNRGNFGSYALDDTLRIAIENNVVRYYKNGTLLYTSTVAPTLPLKIDVALESDNSSLDHMTISNRSDGTLAVFNTTGLGANPSYQWKLNGTNVGENNPAYSNPLLSVNDEVSVEITPDYTGCADFTFTSDVITMVDIDADKFPVIDDVSKTDLTDCNADNGSIVISATGAGVVEYSIDGGETWQLSNEFNDLMPGIYNVSVKNDYNSCQAPYITPIDITSPAAPVIDNVTATAVDSCTSTFGTITVLASGGISELEYSTDAGSTWTTDTTFDGLPIGTYDVRVRNGDATCETSVVNISIEDASCTVEAVDDNFTTAEGVPLNSTVSQNDNFPGEASFTAMSNPGNGTLEFAADGSFTYTPAEIFSGIDEFAYEVCVGLVCDHATVIITVNSDLAIFVYDGFSPNGDNENDIWTIQGIHNYPDNNVKIFDRWGILLFETTGYDNAGNAWGGEGKDNAFGKKEVPPGTYFYVIRLNAELKPLTGYLSLYR